MRYATFWVCGFWLAQGLVLAQGPVEARVQALEEQVRALQQEIQTLRTALSDVRPSTSQTQAGASTEPGAPAPSSVAQPAPAGLPVYGGATAASKVFNPDIAVIGNFIGGAGRNPANPFPALSLRETEVSFQAIIDPYARGDFFVSIGENGAEIEEGYITFPALPGRLSLRAGRMRAGFGKINAMHNHTLPWLDRPLVTYNLLGGDPSETDAGIKDNGLSISRILPSPRGLFLEAVAEVYGGNSGTLFKASRHSDLSSVGHLRAYRDLTESTNLEIGGSYARGHNSLGSGFATQLFGGDMTLRWKPLRRAIYHSFNARAEADWSRREQPGATVAAHGFFTSAEYQFARRWFAGARLDWSERATRGDLHDSGESAVVTFWPSEFSQVRGQLRRTHYAEGFVANELLFQFQYSLGAHGAHPF